MRQREHVLFRPLLILGLMLSVMIVAFGAADKTGWALPASGEATIFSPNRVGGASGHEDERDADLYPAVAYDPSTGQYLAVWLTARNAGSSSDGFDVYGVFLDRIGQPAGSEFRIEAVGGGSYRFVRVSGGTLSECELTPVSGQGGFKAGVALPGALRGDFPGIGPVDFSLTKLGSNRFIISAHLPHDEISTMRIKHGGPHGVDD